MDLAELLSPTRAVLSAWTELGDTWHVLSSTHLSCLQGVLSLCHSSLPLLQLLEDGSQGTLTGLQALLACIKLSSSLLELSGPGLCGSACSKIARLLLCME